VIRLSCVMGLACVGMVVGCGGGDDTESESSLTGSPVVDASEASDVASEALSTEAADDDGGSDAEEATEANPSVDAGVASATFASGGIALGPAGCGAAAVTSMFSISNGGTAPLSVTAATTGSAFAVSPASLSVAPGGSGALVITGTVPGSATAGTALTGSLNLFTSDPAHANISVPLSVTPSGATIAFAPSSPTTAAFPSTGGGSAATPIALTLVNTGNGPATVTVGTPSDPQFAVSEVPSSGSLAPGATLTATAGFTPNVATTAMAMATATVTVSGATCGTSVSSISFSGAVAHAQVAGWPTAPVDFGPAPCGGAAPPYKLIILTNSGGGDAHFTSVVLSGAPGFSTGNMSGPIPAGGSFAFSVLAPAVPTPSPLTPITATLTIQTDADTSPHTITLTEEPQGAVLAFDTSPTPNFGSFGSVVLLQGATQNFNVTNMGNAAANVTLTATQTGGGDDAGAPTTPADAGPDATLDVEAPPPPFVVSNAAFSIAASGSQSDSVTFSPTAANGESGTIAMSTTDVLCSPLPAAIPVSGVGIGGGPSVAPTSIAFSASCGGAAAAPQTFTVSNNGTVNLNWMMGAVTGSGSTQYAVAAVPPPGLLMPGGSSTVTVTPAAIPSPASDPAPSAFAAQIVITTDVPFDNPHVVSLSETALGDELSLSVQSFRFGQFPIGTTTLPQTFTVTNNANAGSPAANVSLALQGAGASTYAVTPTTIANLAPGGGVSSTESVTFDPPTAVSDPASIVLTTLDSLCTVLPAPIQLTGTGTQGIVSVSATTLAFGTDASDPAGLVNCGATGLPNTFTVSNVGNQSFQITALTLGLGTSSPFVLSGPGTSLPATVGIGDSVTITVTPNAIPQAVANPNDATPFSDTLTVATNAAQDSPHAVSLVMQARGAVIVSTPLTTAWSFGTITEGSIGTFTSTIQNTGNAAASVALTGLAQPTIFGLQNNPTTVIANGTTSIVGQFTPPSPDGSWSDQATLVVTAPQAFCEPLPATWTSPTITLSGASNSTAPVSYSGTLSFPTTDCGSAAPGSQTIILTNNTNQAYAMTVGLNAGVFYAVSSSSMVDGGSGILPANGTATIVVTPQTITPGPTTQAGSTAYADDLLVGLNTVVPDAGAGASVTSFTIPISWTLNGAVLSLPQGLGPNTDGMGNAFYPADTTSGFTLPMANSGTAAASVTFAINPAGVFAFSPAPPVQVVTGGPTAPQLTSSTSNATCPATTSGTATFFYSGPVCRPFQFPTVTVDSCVGTF
jgi:hypothetical protein